jgi:hypothetical protein
VGSITLFLLALLISTALKLPREAGSWVLDPTANKDNLAEVYLQGDDDAVPQKAARKSIPIGKRPEGTYARIFQDEIEQIDNLPEPEYPAGFLTEQAIDQYF